MPLFDRGLPSLAPGSRIDFHWGYLGDLLPFLKDNGEMAKHVTVTVRYTDLTGNRYEHDWDVEPAVLEGIRAPGCGRPGGDGCSSIPYASDGDPGRDGNASATDRR